MRSSRTLLAAVSTATRAAASQDSLLTPTTSVTRYTLSAIRTSLWNENQLTLSRRPAPLAKDPRRTRPRAAAGTGVDAAVRARRLRGSIVRAGGIPTDHG